MEFFKYTASYLQYSCNSFASVFNNSTSYLYIMKGAFPTDAQIKTANYAFVNSTRGTDSLISYPLSGKVTYTVAAQKFTITQLPYTTAVRSGDATWFALINSANTDFVIIGDITNTAGTGVLRMDNVSIVSGTKYKLNQMVLTMPSELAM